MSNNKSKVLLGAATLAAAMVAGSPADAATTKVPMTAKIIQAVQITQTASLLFGTLTVNATSGGTVVVDNADSRSATGGVSLVGGTTAQSGAYQIKAATGLKIDVTAPATATMKAGGANTLNVTGFTFDGAAGPLVHTQVAATDTGLKIGGTLNVPVSHPTGSYTGTVTLTANYQ